MGMLWYVPCCDMVVPESMKAGKEAKSSVKSLAKESAYPRPSPTRATLEFQILTKTTHLVALTRAPFVRAVRRDKR